MDIITLHKQIAAVAPILGVSVGNPSDKTTWRIDFAPGTTQAQVTAAQAVVVAFDATKLPYVAPNPRAWLERLSPTTQAAIAAAGAASPAILLWLLKAAGTPAIDVTGADAIAGVGALRAANVITDAEQTILLAP